MQNSVDVLLFCYHLRCCEHTEFLYVTKCLHNLSPVFRKGSGTLIKNVCWYIVTVIFSPVLGLWERHDVKFVLSMQCENTFYI
jgi:hypothetical protein